MQRLYTDVAVKIVFGWTLSYVLALAAVVTAAETALVPASLDLALPDANGKVCRVADLGQNKVLVIALLGTECPMARQYAVQLTKLQHDYADRGVAVIGVDPNTQDSADDLLAFAKELGIEFPLLRDSEQKLADRLGGSRTPEVFVFDRERRLQYRGRIDDQFGLLNGGSYKRASATREDLKVAVDELLAGNKVSVPETPVQGCLIGRAATASSTPREAVTYAGHVAAVLQNHCLECHRAGRIGPFSMEDPEEVVGWGPMIAEVVEAGRMPPWHASPEHGQFSNDPRLTPEEKRLIAEWVAGGCVLGDLAKMPVPPSFSEGWAIGKPDQIVYAQEQPFHVPASGVIDYQYFVVNPGWKEDVWLRGIEPRPGSRETVHHILVFYRNPGAPLAPGFDNLMAIYAPGSTPTLNSDGKSAMRLPAGCELVFQIHYNANGRAQDDRTALGLRFADPAQVEQVVETSQAANLRFVIPPGDAKYAASASKKYRRETTLRALGPHLHNRGRAFRFEAEFPDGRRQVLLDVPRFDPNWQPFYLLKEPLLMPAGSKLHCTAMWDNSVDNPWNPDPKKTVRWGDQTWDEMLIGFTLESKPRRTDQASAKTTAPN